MGLFIYYFLVFLLFIFFCHIFYLLQGGRVACVLFFSLSVIFCIVC